MKDTFLQLFFFFFYHQNVFLLDSTHTKATVARVGVVSCMCLRDVSKYYYGIKKYSKEPFNIKIATFQPGSMLVVLSCLTT